MNFFSYWTNQIAPYAEKASPFLTVATLASLVVYWLVWSWQKKRTNSTYKTDWSKIPLTILMLSYTFQWSFVPDFGNFLSDLIVMLFILTSLAWLIDHYKTPLVENSQSSENSEQDDPEQKNDQ